MPTRKKTATRAKGEKPKPKSKAKSAALASRGRSRPASKPASKPAARPNAATKAKVAVRQPKPTVRPAPTTRAAAVPVAKVAPLTRTLPRAAAAAGEKDVMEIDWTLFGELSRALALKVARAWDPDLVIGIATAGVIPGATIAAILDREFHSMIISRRYHADTVRATPAVFGQVPAEVRDQHVLVVDETCDSGATLRLAVAALLNAGAADVRTAVASGPAATNRTSSGSRPSARSSCRGIARSSSTASS